MHDIIRRSYCKTGASIVRRRIEGFRCLAGAGSLCVLLLVGGCVERSDDADLKHFVYFGLERHRISEATFLETRSILGAQLKYTWRELEPEMDRYDFSSLREDLSFLLRRRKRLFIQIQDVSFDERIINVPDYLLNDPVFRGGIARKYEFEDDDESKPISDGWVARRWDPAVRTRFARLLAALGREFDGRLEGVNLSETSIGFGESVTRHPEGFTHDGYLEAIKEQMHAMKEAFSHTATIQYANFMPGEWLPWEDNGYLRGVYAYADRIGVGVGGPDLMPFRKGQLNHSYPLIAGRAEDVVAGVAVQWGNLEQIDPSTGDRITVRELVRFAEEELHLDYMFWGIQEPFYTREILPYLWGLSSDP